MKRKVISIKTNFGYVMPQLPQKILQEDKIFNQMNFCIGDVDPEWEQDKLHIEIIAFDYRCYYSVPIEMTLDLLNDSIGTNGENLLEDYDIREETNLDEDFVTLLLNQKPNHLDKYKEDNNYLTYLGNLPAAPRFLILDEPSQETPVGISTN